MRRRKIVLAKTYSEGLDVARDLAEAVNWFRYGAEQGYAPAQLSLGLQYADGRGVAKNYAEALKWFNIAAELGEDAGAKYREALIGLMTPDQAAAARTMANLWLLKNQRRQ